MPTDEEDREDALPGSAPNAQAAPPSPTAPAPEIIEASQLLRGANEVIIRHAGQTYRLRVTRANKLLLIK